MTFGVKPESGKTNDEVVAKLTEAFKMFFDVAFDRFVDIMTSAGFGKDAVTANANDSRDEAKGTATVVWSFTLKTPDMPMDEATADKVAEIIVRAKQMFELAIVFPGKLIIGPALAGYDLIEIDVPEEGIDD